ncbi:MAG: hypothetical protein CL583_02460 [Alteromonadaceae bacterium]|uniref:Uncharacterized protein n=2 Tax=Hydrocarboniclastica marina TaxID=2259620 RepID=A0A4P7XJ97_9ALTE|nr:hypothetical protein [Alteromonadaceae bacterium]QCF27191.1 hypothetical protein soil367_15335 [Hydrocarboniclastica marina]|tara:strand:- start:1258 stop:1617 length:360 start_codon:yes stop_codon:yes gene_type:complete
MPEISLQTFFGLVGLAGAASMLLGLLVLRLTLTHRLKKKLKPNGEYWDSGTLDFGFINTALFAWACTLPYVQRSERFRLIYRDLDVKSFANWFETAAAYATIGGVAIFFLFGPLIYLFD